MGGKNDHDRAANFCWIRSSFSLSVTIIEFQTTETYPSLRVAGVYNDYDDECGSEEYHMEQVTGPSVTGVVLMTQHKNSAALYLNEGISNIQRAAMCGTCSHCLQLSRQ